MTISLSHVRPAFEATAEPVRASENTTQSRFRDVCVRLPERTSMVNGALGWEIQEMLKRKPMFRSLSTCVRSAADFLFASNFRLMTENRLRLPRLIALHELLCESFGMPNARTVINGPGGLPYSAFTIAMLGGCVLIKEPDLIGMRMHAHAMQYAGWHDYYARMSYVLRLNDINRYSGAHITYWNNPSPTMGSQGLEHYDNLADTDDPHMIPYLGRDVVLGGYLVLQSPEQRYLRLPYDPRVWRCLFSGEIGLPGVTDHVMPSAYFGSPARLTVWRRIA